MKAAVYRTYGGPEVVSVEDVARPEPGKGELVVQVTAAAVTSADWRLRAAAFPSFTWLPGRLMFGLFRPRKPVLGGAFAGQIAAVGEGVTRFREGDAVFGFSNLGAHAEYVCLGQDSAIATQPADISDEAAASLPFGGLAALVFLRDFAALQPGERVLVIGASGGVGSHAVQIARALGAQVDGTCSAAHVEFVRGLGAERIIDYQKEDFTKSDQQWDVILDCVGGTSFSASRRSLTSQGRFVPLDMTCASLFQALANPFRRGPKVVLGINSDRAEDLEVLAGMVGSGDLRPMVDRVYPLAQVRAAHEDVESRHRAGIVVLSLA